MKLRVDKLITSFGSQFCKMGRIEFFSQEFERATASESGQRDNVPRRELRIFEILVLNYFNILRL